MKKIVISFLVCLMGVGAQAQSNFFEGVINFRSYENHSKAVVNYSAGQAYNGARDFQIFVKGLKAAKYDKQLGMRTIFDPDGSRVVVVFDALKKAVVFDFDAYVGLYSTYSPNRMSIDQKEMGEQQQILGYTCHKTKYTLKPQDGTNTTCVIEAWTCDEFNLYKNYWNATLYGLELPGLLLKYTLDSQSRAPFVGELASYVAAEVKIIEKEVADSDFAIPADYQTIFSLPESEADYAALVSVAKLNKYLKENTAALKKAKTYPTMKIDDAVRFDIANEWDF